MDESAESRTVEPGSEFDVELEARPTAGYQWSQQVAGAALELLGHDWETGGAVGGTAKQRFRFRAAGAGEARVTFDYGRSGDPQPLRRHNLQVTVRQGH